MYNDWTKLTSKDIDVQAFIKKMEKMKSGSETVCPFCGGIVTMVYHDLEKTTYACDSCDMRIDTENRNN